MKFTKMHGLGNDYVYVNTISQNIKDPSETAKKLSDRHYGIGADGLILIGRSSDADFKMEIYNSDGSSAKMCGNGIRCVGKYVYEKGLTKKKILTVETPAGIKKLFLSVIEDQVKKITVDMGKPEIGEKHLPIQADGIVYDASFISMGNHHIVIQTEDLKNLVIEKAGPKLEKHFFFPDRVNVEFIHVKNENEIEVRVWERGSGETLACGTGACAAAIAYMADQSDKREIKVLLKGGELLVRWEKEGNVYMTGPAEFVFEGEINV